MKRPILLLLALAVVSPAAAATTITGNQQVTAEGGIGTLVPQAVLEVRMSSTDAYALKVSSQNGSPLLWIDNLGQMTVGLSSAQADLDVNGSGDSGGLGLSLRVGNSSSNFSSAQIIFTSTGGLYPDSIRTRANGNQAAGNAIDFFLFRSTQNASVLGTENVMSLVALSTAGLGAMHVRPAGVPDVELEVSDGFTTGGGTIHRAQAGQHSSRDLKSDLSVLGAEDEERAVADVESLRHVKFRYRRPADAPPAPLMRGLIYEDTPDSVRGGGETVVIDERVTNLELALKAACRRIAELKAKIAFIEQNRRERRP